MGSFLMSDSWRTTLSEHLRLVDRLFETIALTLQRASDIGEKHPSVSRRVTMNLLIQIAQDIKAVSLLASSGFPYHAVTISVSTFEHGMMVASIGSDNARAQKWLDHSDETKNIDSVRQLVELATDNLERAHHGLKAALGDPYKGMFTKLCTFKHGNPMVQQHMHSVLGTSFPLSTYSVADRRAVIAAFWAFEAVIRSGWIALLSFIKHHVHGSEELTNIANAINRSLNEVMKIRFKKESEPI
jgi:hypothetical protein